MKLFRVQLHRHDKLPLDDNEKLDRVDYEELLDQLHYPVIWVYEHYFQAWLPSEVDHAFLNTIKHNKPNEQNLKHANLLELPKINWEDLQSDFATNGYVVIPQMLNEDYAKKQLAPYYRRQYHLHRRHADMKGISRTSINNLAWMRLIHQASEKLVKYVVAPTEIKTSYSFASEYDAGSNLPRHTDRPQCIYNISLLLGSSPENANLSSWPLFIERNGVAFSANLNAGDAVLYSGTRDPHWRDITPPNIESVLGVFFHYVTKDFIGSLD